VEFWLGDRDFELSAGCKYLDSREIPCNPRLGADLVADLWSRWVVPFAMDRSGNRHQMDTNLYFSGPAVISLCFKQPDSLAEAAAIWTTQSFNFE
jgi:hypothetical protein